MVTGFSIRFAGLGSNGRRELDEKLGSGATDNETSVFAGIQQLLE
jgi:hypothetical protein